MSHGLISGLFTAGLIIMFLGIWRWAWLEKNKSRYEQIAQMPLEDD